MSAWDEDVGENPLTQRYWIGRIDLRPMALFRIAMGLFSLWDIGEFAVDLRSWFSDEGVMPRSAFLSQWARQTRLCLLDSFATPTQVWIYWAVSVVFAVMMLVGYRTRLASLVTWILMCGYQERIPPLFDGSDTVVRMMFFWHIFTSSGNVWSIDAIIARARGTPLSEKGPAFPVRLTQLQIGWIYLCSAFYKAQGPKWSDGSAVHYALHLAHVFARPWNDLIADNVFLVHAMTWGTLVVESSFLFLSQSPVLHRPLKVLAMLGATGLHFGIFMTINVGHFSYLMPMTYLCLFETEWAQKVADVASRLLRFPERLPGIEAFSLKLPTPVARPTPAWAVRAQRPGWAVLAIVAFFASWLSMPAAYRNAYPHVAEASLQYASLWSNWDMFAPDPLSTDYRLSMPAEFEDGTTADLFGGPKDGPGEVRGFWFTRWWKYLENVTGNSEVLPLEYGRYLCREHNFGLKPGQPRLYTFTLFKDNQNVPAFGQPWPKVERQTVWVHRCFDKPADRQPKAPVAQAK